MSGRVVFPSLTDAARAYTIHESGIALDEGRQSRYLALWAGRFDTYCDGLARGCPCWCSSPGLFPSPRLPGAVPWSAGDAARAEQVMICKEKVWRSRMPISESRTRRRPRVV